MNTWYNQSISYVVSLFATDMERGLTDKEVVARLARYGQKKVDER
jgi:hypothetical protein